MKPYKSLLTDEYATFKKEFKVISTIIPNNVRLTTYSSPEFKGLLGGPYTGQIHLPQLDWVSIGSFTIEDASNDGDKKDDGGDKKKEDDGDKKKDDEAKTKSDRKETIKDDGDKGNPELKEMIKNVGDKKEEDGDKKKYYGEENKSGEDKEKSERKELIKDALNPSSSAAIDMYLDKGKMVRNNVVLQWSLHNSDVKGHSNRSTSFVRKRQGNRIEKRLQLWRDSSYGESTMSLTQWKLRIKSSL